MPVRVDEHVIEVTRLSQIASHSLDNGVDDHYRHRGQHPIDEDHDRAAVTRSARRRAPAPAWTAVQVFSEGVMNAIHPSRAN